MPKRKAKDVIKAAFDPEDDPAKPPRQSVSEEQVIITTNSFHLPFLTMTFFHSIWQKSYLCMV